MKLPGWQHSTNTSIRGKRAALQGAPARVRPALRRTDIQLYDPEQEARMAGLKVGGIANAFEIGMNAYGERQKSDNELNQQLAYNELTDRSAKWVADAVLNGREIDPLTDKPRWESYAQDYQDFREEAIADIRERYPFGGYGTEEAFTLQVRELDTTNTLKLFETGEVYRIQRGQVLAKNGIDRATSMAEVESTVAPAVRAGYFSQAEGERIVEDKRLDFEAKLILKDLENPHLPPADRLRVIEAAQAGTGRFGQHDLAARKSFVTAGINTVVDYSYEAVRQAFIGPHGTSKNLAAAWTTYDAIIRMSAEELGVPEASLDDVHKSAREAYNLFKGVFKDSEQVMADVHTGQAGWQAAINNPKSLRYKSATDLKHIAAAGLSGVDIINISDREFFEHPQVREALRVTISAGVGFDVIDQKLNDIATKPDAEMALMTFKTMAAMEQGGRKLKARSPGFSEPVLDAFNVAKDFDYNAALLYPPNEESLIHKVIMKAPTMTPGEKAEREAVVAQLLDPKKGGVSATERVLAVLPDDFPMTPEIEAEAHRFIKELYVLHGDPGHGLKMITNKVARYLEDTYLPVDLGRVFSDWVIFNKEGPLADPRLDVAYTAKQHIRIAEQISRSRESRGLEPVDPRDLLPEWSPEDNAYRMLNTKDGAYEGDESGVFLFEYALQDPKKIRKARQAEDRAHKQVVINRVEMVLRNTPTIRIPEPIISFLAAPNMVPDTPEAGWQKQNEVYEEAFYEVLKGLNPLVISGDLSKADADRWAHIYLEYLGHTRYDENGKRIKVPTLGQNAAQAADGDL